MLPEVAALIGLRPSHATTLWRCFVVKGLPGLLATRYQGRIPRLNAEESSVPLRLYQDGAPSHRAKNLVVPQGIELKDIPSYSSELNPAERFF